MFTEIELKLRLPDVEAPGLPAHARLAGCAAQTYPLFNTYYDTPELDLRQRGVALRLRRKGRDTWLMTVKGGDAAAGGLAQRCEWEAPTAPGVLDFAIVGDGALREFLESCASRLRPLFSTDFTRTAWSISVGDAVVELALDRGTISSGADAAVDTPALSERLCEVELELVAGHSPDALFELAIELAGELHLHPEMRSKAERGYALAGASPADVATWRAAPITPHRAPVEAFRAIAFACLVHLQRNERGAIAGDAERLHQARVAIRRLRSAFKLFAPALSPAFVAVYAPRWRDLARRLGSTRDWDVLVGDTLLRLEAALTGEPALALLRERGVSARNEAQRAAAAALSAPAYSQLLLAFSAALWRQGAPTIARVGRDEVGLRAFMQRRLSKRAKAIARRLGDADLTSAERCHDLRIRLKALRDALGFFSPLLAGRRRATYQAALTAAVDRLGVLTDEASAARLVGTLALPGEAAALVRGWLAGRRPLLADQALADLRRFTALDKPWR